MNRIRHNLYLGDKHDANPKTLVGTAITAVLNVAAEVPIGAGRNIKWHKVGMRDEAASVVANEEEAINVLNQLLSQGETVLVHCLKGRSRSAHIVAETLARREGVDYFQMYEQVRALRPCVLAYSMGREIIDRKTGWIR